MQKYLTKMHPLPETPCMFLLHFYLKQQIKLTTLNVRVSESNQIREIRKLGMSGKELRIESSWHKNCYV